MIPRSPRGETRARSALQDTGLFPGGLPVPTERPIAAAPMTKPMSFGGSLLTAVV